MRNRLKIMLIIMFSCFRTSSSSSAAISEWFKKGPQRLGGVYKKVAFVEYTDKTFTKKITTAKMLMGPELRGEVGDKFQVGNVDL